MIKADLFHQNNLDLHGISVVRQAVRALIFRGNTILLMYSSINGDYKLPGGGIKTGEDHREALKREVLEESGYFISEIVEKIGEISEYSKALEDDVSYFRMDSHYYKCEISEKGQVNQNLDDYERDLDMKPLWITIDEALKRNRQVFLNNPNPPKWTKREIFFLESLKRKKLN